MELLSEYLQVVSSTHTDFTRASVLLTEHDEKSSTYHQTSLDSEERCKQLEEEKKQLQQSQEKEVKVMKKQIDKLKREILEAGDDTEPLEIEISDLKSKIMMDEMENAEVLSKLKKTHQEELQRVRVEMRSMSSSSSSKPSDSNKGVATSSKLADLEKKLGASEASLRDNEAALHFANTQSASLRESTAEQLDQVASTPSTPSVAKVPPPNPPPAEDAVATFVSYHLDIFYCENI